MYDPDRPKGPGRVGSLYLSEDTLQDVLRTISSGGDYIDMSRFLTQLEPAALVQAYGYEVNRGSEGCFSFEWQLDDLWVVASGAVAKNGVIYWEPTRVEYQEAIYE